MFQKSLEMFCFPVVKSSLRFPSAKNVNVKIVGVPATSFVNDFAGTAKIFALKKRSEDSTCNRSRFHFQTKT